MTLGEYIKDYRTKHKMSMDSFSARSGISKSYISLLEKNAHPKTGKRIAPSIQFIKQVADATHIDFNELFNLLDGDVSLDESKIRKGIEINVLGRVAAGIPIEAVEEVIDTEEITEEMARNGKYFGLLIKGDSMLPAICDQDVVIVRQQDDAESGDTVIALVNGDDATCKRLCKYKDGIELIPNNPSFSPMYFSNDDIQRKPVRILGKVVELRRKF